MIRSTFSVRVWAWLFRQVNVNNVSFSGVMTPLFRALRKYFFYQNTNDGESKRGVSQRIKRKVAQS